MDRKTAKRMDRFTQYAIAATALALEDGEIDLDKLDKDKIGAVLGSGIGGMTTLEKEHENYWKKGTID